MAPQPFIFTAVTSRQQVSLAQTTEWVQGTTLRNIPAWVRFRPAPTNTGRVIQVTRHEKLLYQIRVSLVSGQYGRSWTDAVNDDGLGVGVIEHPGAAVVLAGLDNVIMQVEYPKRRPATVFYKGGGCSSVPLLTGTAQPYLAAIAHAGLLRQAAPRQWLTVEEKVEFSVQGNTFILKPRNQPGWSLGVGIKPSPAPWWQGQAKYMEYDTADADLGVTLQSIATARPTNGNWKNWALFKALTLGTGRKMDFSAVYSPFNPYTPCDGQAPYQPNEAVRHRHLDLLGDLFFFGGWWNVDMQVLQGRHFATDLFRQWLMENWALKKAYA